MSVTAIKKILDSEYGKNRNAAINNEIANLTLKRLLINTSGLKGSSGSFVINPDFDSFDSRRNYLSVDLGNVDRTIENVITKICYDGKPCLGEVNRSMIFKTG